MVLNEFGCIHYMFSQIEQEQISQLQEQLQTKDEMLQAKNEIVRRMSLELETLKSKTGIYTCLKFTTLFYPHRNGGNLSRKG